MSLIDQLQAKLQKHPKRVVFAEGADPRILQAARQFATRKLGVPILLGDRSKIKTNAQRLDINLKGIRILEPERSEDAEIFIPMIQEYPPLKNKDLQFERDILLQKKYFAALMVSTGRADALVSGATSTASSALQPILQIVPRQKETKAVSSLLVLDMEREEAQQNRILFLADCGVIPEPTNQELSEIAITTASIAKHLTNETPRIAMLSWATKARRKELPASIIKVRKATQLVESFIKRNELPFLVEGEIQLDAALDPHIAEQKRVGNSPVAGHANVLIFPDLNSGNIASKMIQILANARSYGNILTGLKHPCAEISRGAHAYDIFGTAIIVGAQAIDANLLYGIDNEA